MEKCCWTNGMLIGSYTLGPGGNETKAWANAAGLHGRNDFYDACHTFLTQDTQFPWPDGTDSVDLGFRDPIKRPKHK